MSVNTGVSIGTAVAVLVGTTCAGAQSVMPIKMIVARKIRFCKESLHVIENVLVFKMTIQENKLLSKQ